MFEALILDGTITLVALAVLVVEIIVIFVVARRRGSAGLRVALASACSGVFLMLALRGALLEQGAGPIALWLGLALVAHATDLIGRFRSSQ